MTGEGHRPWRRGAIGGLALAGLTGAVLAWRGRHVTPYRPQLERLDIPVPAGHHALVGMTIAFVTDIHMSPFFSQANFRDAIAPLRDERVDLVLLGGDYASETVRYIERGMPVLDELAGMARLGAYGVLGNHDEQLGSHKVAEAFEAHAIPLLRNEARGIPFNGSTLWLVGIDDALAGHHDPDAAFRDVPAGAAALALWHEPDWAEQAERRGAFLQLSGHTHGGQIRLPGKGALALPPGGRRFDMGSYRVGAMTLYVSRGVGTYRPPLRFRCHPEITLITLVARSDQAILPE
ncbi:MAG: metallophosphoesterase [Chloroflexota bacterium]|nr:metallophosphoesterase [Chloroflexota bacterium]